MLAASVLSLASLVPLTIVVGVLGARLRLLGITRGGAALAHMAGSAAVALSAVSALVLWVLSRPEVRDQPGVVRALHDPHCTVTRMTGRRQAPIIPIWA